MHFIFCLVHSFALSTFLCKYQTSVFKFYTWFLFFSSFHFFFLICVFFCSHKIVGSSHQIVSILFLTSLISFFYPLLYPASISPSCQYLSQGFFLSPSWKAPFLYWKIDTSVFFLNVLFTNLLSFLLFSRRESPRSSTSLPSFLYGFPSFSRRVSFPLFLIRYIPLFPPFLSLSPCVMINASPCGNGFFSIDLPSLSIRFFLHRPLFSFIFPFSRAYIYYNV